MLAPRKSRVLCLVLVGMLLSSWSLAADKKKEGEAKEAAGKEVPKRASGGTAVPPHAGQRSLERNFAANFLSDQKAFWTSPVRSRLSDTYWLMPFATFTGGLIASDTSIEKKLPTSPTLIKRSQDFSKFAAASFVGAAGSFYLWGRLTNNDHARETGLLSGEALANSLVNTSVIKVIAGRNRPREGNGKGQFWRGGRSFPSGHAAAAWSVAYVIAQEYPGTMTKLLAYGAASAVTVSRVTGREHFASDAFLGSALGWYVGRQVYRAHHDPDTWGTNWGTFETSHEPQPENMGSAYVPLDSWVYPAFDRLAALGYAQSGLVGLRPWTRMECARLVKDARNLIQMDGWEPSEALRLYRSLEKEFTEELGRWGGDPNLGVHLESIYTRFTGIAGTPLRDGYHFGQTIVNDYGRPYAEGFNVVTGVTGRAEAGPFAFYVRGEYQHAPEAPPLSDSTRQLIRAVDGLPQLPNGLSPAVNRFALLDAYVAFTLKNVQISFGKQSFWWGPGLGGPMVFSNNAEPIYALRISRVSPFELPGVLRYLGQFRTEMFVGRLAGHEFISTYLGEFGPPIRPQPYLHGEKVSFKPTPNLEFGFSETTVFSGPGFPLTSHTFFRSYSLANTVPGVQDDPGDRRAGFDFRYAIPGLRKWLTFYTDSFCEDEISPIAFPRRCAWNPGIYMPRIPRLAKLDFRAEGVYTDLPNFRGAGSFYFNGHYRSGYTNLGNLMGNWVGRQGRGIQAWSTYWLSPRSTLQVSYRNANVSPGFIPEGGIYNDFAARTNLWLRPDLNLTTAVQYERWKFRVLAPTSQSNLTSSIQLTFWPGWGLHRSQ